MIAAVLHEPKKIVLEEHEMPILLPGQVLVRVPGRRHLRIGSFLLFQRQERRLRAARAVGPWP